MYAFVEGQLERIGPPTVINASGIGWEIWVPERLRLTLPPVGEMVRLHTHLQVREDEMTLYGFASEQRREIFRGLISVNGVGPKVALNVLGDDRVDEVLRGLRRGDPKPLLAIKGIGRKTAERMVIDLEDKAAAWIDDGPQAPGSDPQDEPSGEDPRASEAVLALEALGVTPDRASAAIVAVLGDLSPTEDVETVLRAALKRLHPAR